MAARLLPQYNRHRLISLQHHPVLYSLHLQAWPHSHPSKGQPESVFGVVHRRVEQAHELDHAGQTDSSPGALNVGPLPSVLMDPGLTWSVRKVADPDPLAHTSLVYDLLPDECP